MLLWSGINRATVPGRLDARVGGVAKGGSLTTLVPRLRRRQEKFPCWVAPHSRVPRGEWW